MCDANPRPGAWSLQLRSVRPAATAEALFCALFADTGADTFWLDSARAAYDMGRYSVMGALVDGLDHRVVYSTERRELRCAETGLIERDIDLWDWLARRVSLNPCQPSSVNLPFLGGYLGYAGYGSPGGTQEVRADPTGRDAEFVHVSRFLVFDHVTGDAHLVAVVPDEEKLAATTWIETMADRVLAVVDPEPVDLPIEHGPAEASVDRATYLADLSQVREWLLAGDSYEACYTYSLSFPLREDPLITYRRLRSANPAPYAAFLHFGDRQILSCSPERYLTVDSSGWAETKPIKGTAKRVHEPEEDRKVAHDLAHDPKSRSENLMIVDLLRNDLGLICSPGTVAVPKLMAVESYATVHQLVSSIRGRLLPHNAAAVHAARALFPGGSMTGAPKIRTVAMLDKLESAPRGVYSGVVGYFSRCGASDLSVVIRTAVVDGDRVAIGTGGAITVGSDPVDELEETIVKSTVLLTAFGRTHPLVDREGVAQ